MAEKETNPGELRGGERQAHRANVVLSPAADPIQGLSDNVSREGIMFYTEGDLRVSVEFDGPDGRQRRSGRVVRVNRVSDEETGMAVEFDPE